MTLNLENFNGVREEKLSTSSFRDAVPAGIQIGTKAASQIAATRSLMVHTSEDEFRATREMLLDPRTRGQFAVEQTALREKLFKQASDSIGGFASDPSIPLDERVALVNAATQEFVSPFSRTPNLDMLAEESLIADGGAEEDDVSSEQRMNIFDRLQEVNSRKRRIANAINAVNMTEDGVTAGKVVDVLELVAPLAEWIHIDRLLEDAQRNLGEGGTDFGQLLGTQKEELFEMIKQIPSSEREGFSMAIIDLVKTHENVLFPDGNDLMTTQVLERMLLDNDYSNFEYWFDNVVSVLDMTFVGGLAVRSVRGGAKGATRGAGTGPTGPSNVLDGEIVTGGTDVALRDVFQGEQIEDIFDLAPSEWTELGDLPRIARSEATVTEVVPTSPSQIVKDTNPDMARNMHEAAKADTTGEAAEALYGSSRTEAVVKDITPEPGIRPDSMPNKVEIPREPQFGEPTNIREARLRNGNTILNTGEINRIASNLSDRLKLQANNVVVRLSDDATLKVTARYNPPNSGFVSYEDAVESAEFAFRNYGMSADNFKVMYRVGDQWKPLKPEAAKKLPQGTPYSIAVDFDYRFRAEDLEEVDLLTTGNFFTRSLDRLPATVLSPAALGQGSLVQNLLDAASAIHPQIVNAASVAVDKTVSLRKLYVDLMKDFSKTYEGLKAPRRAMMIDYINKANFEGIAFNVTDLRARGFNDKEIGALREWRRANDAMWHATNDDLVKTLRARGYKALVHKTSNTLLYGRPVSRNAVGSRSVGFDPSTGSNVKFSREYLDELYDNGGEIVRLDEPIEIDGQWVDFGISRNTPEKGYTRALREHERVLSYRDGYYPVMYDANYFITKKFRGNGGEEITKVVGTARSQAEAEQATKRLGPGHESRKDRRFADMQAQEIGEPAWNASVNSGLSAQRVRGQRLKDYGVDVNSTANTNLVDPLEAVTAQIAGISQRVPMRQYFDMAKKRWMLNYGKHLDLPINPKTGQKEFPTSITQIQGNSNLKSGFVADARTNFNYLYGLENGYINGMDAAYRGAMHMLADLAAELKLPAVEVKLLDSTAISPVQTAKSTAFNLFLSLNPLRQALIQRTQIAMLGVINPKYLANGLLQDMFKLNAQRAGVNVSNETASLLKELEASGILDAVDAHNFVRQDLTRLADLTAMQKAGTLAMRPVEALRKVGFDLAEQDNLLAAWLAHRDLALKQGKDLNDLRVREEILGQTRAFTLNMNRSGDMPYSQNTLGAAAQFLSFVHKFLLQGVTNKSLDRTTRAKLLAYTTAVFGVSATAMAPVIDWALGDMEEGETKDAIQAGLLYKVLNEAATLATGEEQAVNWGDLAPTEAYGVGNTLVGMFHTDLSQMVADSPAGSLMFGANPRLNNMWSTTMRYFSIYDDYDDPELETKLTDVATAFLNLSSGYSNAFQARYALEVGQKLSSLGTVTDNDVTNFEAVMEAFGMSTETETGYRLTREAVYGTGGDFTPDDVRLWYNTLKGQITRRGQSPTESDMARRIMSEAWRVFGQDRAKAAEEIQRMLQRDAADGDYKMFQAIMREAGYVTEDKLREIVAALPAGVVRDRVMLVLETREEQ